MSAALAANKILKKMAREESDADEAQEMLELAGHYERHATGMKTHRRALVHTFENGCVCVRSPGIFSECHKNDEARAQTLLVRVSPHWGRTTCLQLALEANDKDFVAQSGVQVRPWEMVFLLELLHSGSAAAALQNTFANKHLERAPRTYSCATQPLSLRLFSQRSGVVSFQPTTPCGEFWSPWFSFRSSTLSFWYFGEFRRTFKAFWPR